MVNAAAATGELVPPKRIPVNGRPIRLRWLQQVIWSFLAANVGALIIAGLYYLVIQVRWHIGSHTYLFLKPSWDHLFSYAGWAADRHDIRDVYEALLATLFVASRAVSGPMPGTPSASATAATTGTARSEAIVSTPSGSSLRAASTAGWEFEPQHAFCAGGWQTAHPRLLPFERR